MAEEKDIVEQVAEQAKRVDVEAAIQRFGLNTIKLSKPFEWDGKTYEELTMDFLSMTGRDMEAVDDELRANGIEVERPAYNRRYQRLLAARAAKVPSDMVKNLPIQDYNKIVSAAHYFLLLTA